MNISIQSEFATQSLVKCTPRRELPSSEFAKIVGQRCAADRPSAEVEADPEGDAEDSFAGNADLAESNSEIDRSAEAEIQTPTNLEIPPSFLAAGWGVSKSLFSGQVLSPTHTVMPQIVAQVADGNVADMKPQARQHFAGQLANSSQDTVEKIPMLTSIGQEKSASDWGPSSHSNLESGAEMASRVWAKTNSENDQDKMFVDVEKKTSIPASLTRAEEVGRPSSAATAKIVSTKLSDAAHLDDPIIPPVKEVLGKDSAFNRQVEAAAKPAFEGIRDQLTFTASGGALSRSKLGQPYPEARSNVSLGPTGAARIADANSKLSAQIAAVQTGDARGAITAPSEGNALNVDQQFRGSEIFKFREAAELETNSSPDQRYVSDASKVAELKTSIDGRVPVHFPSGAVGVGNAPKATFEIEKIDELGRIGAPNPPQLLETTSLGVLQLERLAPISNAVPLSADAKALAQNQTATAVGQQLAIAVSKHPDGVTELVLSPEELGRVSLSVKSIDGVVTIAILTERPETQDLMRRHIEALAQEFRSLGFHSAEFSFSGERKGPAAHGTLQKTGALEQVEIVETKTDSSQAPILSDGLDLRL